MNWRALLSRVQQHFTSVPEVDAQAVLQVADRLPTSWTRRRFLSAALLGTVAASVVDVEQLLWMPAEKTIFLPSPPSLDLLTPDWISREAMRLLCKNVKFSSSVGRYYDDGFKGLGGARLGHTVAVRIPPRFGPAPMRITSSIEPVMLDQ